MSVGLPHSNGKTAAGIPVWLELPGLWTSSTGARKKGGPALWNCKKIGKTDMKNPRFPKSLMPVLLAAAFAIPARAADVGLYGFNAPRKNTGLVPLEEILSRPVAEMRGDGRNIAVLARAYHGASLDAVWDGGDEFIKTPK